MKTLLDKISNLQKDLKNTNLRDSISKIKYNLDELNEKLERNNIALKQFEIDKNIDNTVEQTKELAKEYDKFSDSKNKDNKQFEEFESKLREISENYQNSIEENEQLGEYKNDYKDFSEVFENLLDKIENQKQNFNKEVSREKMFDSLKNIQKELEKQLENIDNKNFRENRDNNDLKNQNKELKEKLEEILKEEKELQESIEDKNQNNNKEIKETSQEMEELAEQIEKDKEETLDEELVENAQDIRQILDNLVTISFEQEKLLSKTEKFNNQSFESVNFAKEQQLIKNDFDIVRDSIFATMKRVKDLDVACYDKIKEFYGHCDRVNNYLLEGYFSSSVFYQRKMLTNINDLALIFADNFTEKKQQMSGEGKAKNTKVNSSDNKKQAQERKEKQKQQMQQLKQMSMQLKKQLEQLQKNIQNGQEPSSKQFVESLLNQEMMIEQLKQMLREGNQGKQERQILNEINRLFEQNKNDIINRNVSRKTLERQNQILDKFLKAEKAENENEEDDQRQSKRADNIKQQDVKFDVNLMKKKTGLNEFLKQDFINLDLFYLEKTNEYLHNLE